MSWLAGLLGRAVRFSIGQASGAQAVLKTARLRLVCVTSEMLAAEMDGLAALEKAVGARVPAGWPPEHWDGAMLALLAGQLEEDAGLHRFVVLGDAVGWGRTLIGVVGVFPREGGDVEIAYSTVKEFQRQGYGTEAAVAVVEWLLAMEGVASVSAQATVGTPESVRVMERCGMEFVGVGDEDGTVRFRRMRQG